MPPFRSTFDPLSPQIPPSAGYPKPEGKDEGESYTLFRTLPSLSLADSNNWIHKKPHVSCETWGLFVIISLVLGQSRGVFGESRVAAF